MTDGQLAAALFLPLGSYILHALWRVVRSGSASAQAAVCAGYLIVAILSKAALPSLENVALWLPLLYPYAWMGVSALLWLVSTARLSRARADAPSRPVELAAYFHSQLALHAGVALLSLSMPWQSWWLYLFFPPVMAGIGYLWYRTMLWRERQRGQEVFIRRCSSVLAWLVPLSVLAVTARLTPLLLTLA